MKRSSGHCIVPGCKNSDAILSTFRIPDLNKDKERRDKWIKILKLPTLDHYSRKVCEVHFGKSQFSNRQRARLKRDAIPRPFIAKQDMKIDCDKVSILARPPSDPLKNPNILQAQIMPTTSTLTKELRVNLERLSESASSSQFNEIDPLANISSSSKSITQPGCALCKNQSGLRSEHWEYDETVGKFEDLKIFLCKILKLELKLYQDFPFCKKCTTRVEELHTMYVELRLLQLKFEKHTDKLKKDFTRVFLTSRSTIAKQSHDVCDEKVVNVIVQKWNRTKGLQTTAGRLEINSTPPIIVNQIPTATPLQIPSTNFTAILPSISNPVLNPFLIPNQIPPATQLQIPNQILEATPSPLQNQRRTITLPISFIIQPPKKSTATVGVNTEIQYNVNNISESSSDEFEDNIEDSLQSFEENDSAVAELHRKPINSLSSEDLENENAQMNSLKSTSQTKNSSEDNTSGETSSSFKLPVEVRVSKTSTKEMDEESFTANSTSVIGNEKPTVVKEKYASKNPKQIARRQILKSCPVCFQVKKGNGGLATHMLIHTGERPYECSDCGKNFVQIAHLLTHKRNVHGYDKNKSAFDRSNYFESKNRYYNCDLCSNVHIKTKTRYLRHIKDCHLNQEIMDGDTIWFYYCDSQDCTNSFSSQTNLRRHFLEEHYQNDADLLNVCDVCDRVFCLKENLEVHKTSHSSVESVDTVYPCSYCYMVFTTEGELNDHIPRHKIEFKLSQFSHLCELCGEGFLSAYLLYHHRRSTACQTPKRRRAGLVKKLSLQKIKHIRAKKKPTRALLPKNKTVTKRKKNCFSTCEFCGKTGITYNIKRHRFIHTHPEGFKCNICEYVAKHPEYLKRHLITVHLSSVDTELKYVCDICQRPFQTSKNLMVHKIRWHPEESLQEKIHCISCFQLFDTQELMNAHFEEKHPEKICRMNECGKKFAVRRRLINHTRVHTGERPYQCSFCSDSFKNVSILQCHVNRRHTNHRSLFCKLCVTNPGFFDRREFYKHASTSHPELNPTEIMKTNYISRRTVYSLPKTKRNKVSHHNLSNNIIEIE